jgi:hypothetical protein
MYKTMQQLPQDNLLHSIIPFIGYFNLGDFLLSLCYRSDKIASIKSKEYHRRLTCIDNPHKEISKIYTIDSNIRCIKDLKIISHERGESLIWDGVILHRHDGPTILWVDGTIEWYLNGKIHRDDGPAIIEPDGTQNWYKNGLLHRDDGPAIIYPDGGREWWQYNKFHRDDGPAIVNSNGEEFWYIYDRAFNPEHICKKTYLLDGLSVDIYKRPNADKIAVFAYIIIPNMPPIEYSKVIYNDDIRITSVKFINKPKLYSKLGVYTDKNGKSSFTLNADKTNNLDALHAYYETMRTN